MYNGDYDTLVRKNYSMYGIREPIKCESIASLIENCEP
jgi:hypothetical protein